MELIASVASIVQIILRVHGRVGEKQVARSLETSQQKLQIWQKTWLDNNLDTTTTSEALWGTQGLTEIQKLLQTISVTVKNLEGVDGERHKIRSRSPFFNHEKTQAFEHDSVVNKPRSRWKRALQRISEKKSSTVIIKSHTMLELATELSSSIDELWTYSEVAFSSLHGLLATRAVGPVPERSMGNILADAIETRIASMVLYRTCSKSTRVCNLEIDVLGAESQLRRGSVGSSNLSFNLFYHLLMRSHDLPSEEMRDMTIENVTRPEPPVTKNGEIVEYENPDLTVFDLASASDKGIVIRPKTARIRSYFRVAKPPENITLMPETQSLAQILYSGKVSSTTSSTQTLPFSIRIELAYKLVKCALYLLGTPWLASLNSKRIRRMSIKDGQKPYFLDVQTLDLEDLSFEDPEALTESSQLFRIGVLLVEIALSDPEHSAPTEIQELGVRTSKMLTLVQQSMGPQYCKATAFCLRDRRSTSHFGLPEKYQFPEKTGWKPYMMELLEEYHTQVFLRLKEIRKKVKTLSDIEQSSV